MLERRSKGLYFKKAPLFIRGTDYAGREPACVRTADQRIAVITDDKNIYYYRDEQLVWSQAIEFKYWHLRRMSISEDGQFVAVYSAFRNEVNLDVFKANGEPVKEFSLRDWEDSVGDFDTKTIVESLARKEILSQLIQTIKRIKDAKASLTETDSRPSVKHINKKKLPPGPLRYGCSCVAPCSRTGDSKCCVTCGTLEAIWNKPAERWLFECNWCRLALQHIWDY